MATAQPPTENLSEFNSSVFKDANTASLSLTQAQSLFLARTGNATSVATSTSFNGGGISVASGGISVSTDNITITDGGKIVLNTGSIEFDSTGGSVGFGSINLGTGTNTSIGSGSSTTGAGGVAIGYDTNLNSGTTGCIAIGANSSVDENLTNAVAIGNNATVSTSNSIVLGTVTETVICPNNITVAGTVNGAIIARGAVAGNINTVCVGSAISSSSSNNSALLGIGSSVGVASVTVGTASTCNGTSSVTVGRASTCEGGQSIVIGSASHAPYANSSSIGYGVTTTAANQIRLGRNTETVICPGTASNTSLVATSNITVAGLTIGTSNPSLYPGAIGNTLFGVGCGGAINNATADYNTLIGNNAGAGVSGGNGNTFIGFEAGKATNAGSTNTVIGYNAFINNTGGNANTVIGVGSGVSTATGVISSTAVGNDAICSASHAIAMGSHARSAKYGVAIGSGGGITNGANAGAAGVAIGGGDDAINGAVATGNGIAIGYNSVAAAGSIAIGVSATATANQVVLGSSSQYVLCKGTNTTNGALQLDGALVLQSTYGATPASTMLGYQIALTAVAITTISTTVVTNFGSLALTSGVWAVNFSVELNVASAGGATVTNHSFYFADSDTGGFGASRIANTGAIVNRASTVYAYLDKPVFSGGGVIYTSAGRTIYPNIYLSYSGTITGDGWASATRIG